MRRCIGAAFAHMEMDVVLRTLLREFELVPTTDARRALALPRRRVRAGRRRPGRGRPRARDAAPPGARASRHWPRRPASRRGPRGAARPPAERARGLDPRARAWPRRSSATSSGTPAPRGGRSTSTSPTRTRASSSWRGAVGAGARPGRDAPIDPEPEWATQVDQAIDAYLGLLAAEPAMTLTFASPSLRREHRPRAARRHRALRETACTTWWAAEAFRAPAWHRAVARALLRARQRPAPAPSSARSSAATTSAAGARVQGRLPGGHGRLAGRGRPLARCASMR